MLYAQKENSQLRLFNMGVGDVKLINVTQTQKFV